MRRMTFAMAMSLVAIAFLGGNGIVVAGNGWGWAKPLNQKAGSIFYTTNRRSKSSYRPTTRHFYAVPTARRSLPVQRGYYSPRPATIRTVVPKQTYPAGPQIRGRHDWPGAIGSPSPRYQFFQDVNGYWK